MSPVDYMALDHDRDYQRINANRELRTAIADFFKTRGEDRLDSPIREMLCTVDERLDEDSQRLVRKWD